MMTDATVLSLILCSRNDQHDGNSVWRLRTALNYLAQSVHELGLESRVEVIVSDWGSEPPLKDVLDLTVEAARVTHFLEIPPPIAKREQKDSPFPEVLANNAAARRASGYYIGRIDQDTLVGKLFLRRFLAMVEGTAEARRRLEAAFLFVGRRSIPREFAVQCLPLADVTAFVDRFGGLLPREGKGRKPWFDAPVGIMVLHRRLWQEASGYDERLLYWGFMETELAYRLGSKYPPVDLEKLIGCHFYHLRHSRNRFVLTRRRKNPKTRSPETSPPEQWGLAQYALNLEPAPEATTQQHSAGTAGGREHAAQRRSLVPRYAFAVLKEWCWEVSLCVLRRFVYGFRSCRSSREAQPGR
jgi:hypothetical protein